jgi:2-haloacid dehalogenase
VDAVVFDVGGVLLEWNPRHLYRELIPDETEIETFLAAVCNGAWNAELDRGRPWSEAIQERIALFPQYADLIRAYRERWEEMIPGQIDGTVRILERLDDAGVPVYALTNFSLETFAMVRDRYSFFQRFRGIVVSGAEGVIKPEPAIYRTLCDRYDLDPARILFIDDAEVNVDGARLCGWKAVRFTSSDALEKDLVGFLHV